MKVCQQVIFRQVFWPKIFTVILYLSQMAGMLVVDVNLCINSLRGSRATERAAVRSILQCSDGVGSPNSLWNRSIFFPDTWMPTKTQKIVSYCIFAHAALFIDRFFLLLIFIFLRVKGFMTILSGDARVFNTELRKVRTSQAKRFWPHL